MVISRMVELKYLEPLREKRRAEERARIERRAAQARAEVLAQVRSEVRAELRGEIRAEVLTEILVQILTAGRAEFAEKLQEWNRRRLEAEARGELFDEPLPDLTQP